MHFHVNKLVNVSMLTINVDNCMFVPFKSKHRHVIDNSNGIDDDSFYFLSKAKYNLEKMK